MRVIMGTGEYLRKGRNVLPYVATLMAAVALTGCKADEKAVFAVQCPDGSRLSAKNPNIFTSQDIGSTASIAFGCVKPDGKYIRPSFAGKADPSKSVEDVTDDGDSALYIYAETEDQDISPDIAINLNDAGQLPIAEVEASGYRIEVDAYPNQPSDK